MTGTRDWLSRLLDLAPVAGLLDHRCLLGAPWRIDYAPSAPGTIPYHIVLSGIVTVEERENRRRHRLEAGDIFLLVDGAPHTLHDGSGIRPRPNRVRPTLNVPVTENDGPGEKIDMLCGSFLLSPSHERMLRSYLPSRLVVRVPLDQDSKSRTGRQLASLVDLMRAEAAADHLGGMAILNGLSTALFALVLRLAGESGEREEGLLKFAGNPRIAPALNAMLNDPAHSWTLPELAGLCHMSRATFVRQFEKIVGKSAGDFLTDVRMTAAGRALRAPDTSTGAVAALVGYQSDAAFQRAFKQHMGLTPAQWRKRVSGAEPLAG